MVNEKFVNDNYSFATRNYDEFAAEVADMENSTEWQITPIEKMKVSIKDCDTSDSKILCINDVPIRDVALPSIYGRAHISGSALGKLSPENLRVVLNKCLKTAPKIESAQIVTLGGKISATHSDSYVRLPADKVFNVVNEDIIHSFEQAKFAAGSLSHETLYARYDICDEKLSDIYHDASGRNWNVTPQICVNTSNVGLSGVNIIPSFVRGDVSFIIGSPLSVEHKGEATIERVRENAKMTYSLMRKSITSFAALKNIIIQNPQSCFCNVAKRIGVPKKLAVQALADYQSVLEGVQFSNAHDLYMAMTQAIHYAQYSGNYSENDIANLREIIARALTLKIADYDSPSVEWQNVKLAA